MFAPLTTLLHIEIRMRLLLARCHAARAAARLARWQRRYEVTP